jgi:ABC-2 type transport system permease protein
MSAMAISRPRVRELLRKEFRQILRDPRSRRMLFVAPIVQLLIFGYAVTTDVKDVPLFVLDRDHTADSRALVDALTASRYFVVAQQGARPRELVHAIDHGDIVIGVDIPHGFGAAVAAGSPVAVQLLVDGSSANTATVAMGYATRIIARFGATVTAGRGAGAAGAGGRDAERGVDFRTRAWYNENLESKVYNVPAVMGTIVMMMALLVTALAIVRERELGTLEQLMVSPLQPVELILGKTLPAVAVACADMALVTSVALLWFDVPFRGNPAVLLVAALCFVLTGIGLGLLISTVSKTQQEAFMSMFIFFLPMMLLSGMMFPVENMPEALKFVAELNPIRHFLVVVRGVFLRGAGWSVLAPRIGVLLVMGLAVLAVAVLRFRKTTK